MDTVWLGAAVQIFLCSILQHCFADRLGSFSKKGFGRLPFLESFKIREI